MTMPSPSCIGMNDRSIETGQFDDRLEAEGLVEPPNRLRPARIAEPRKDIGPAGAGAHRIRSNAQRWPSRPEVAVAMGLVVVAAIERHVGEAVGAARFENLHGS